MPTVLLDQRLEGVDSQTIHGVLHPRDFAILAVSMVSLHLDHGLGNIQYLIRTNEGHAFGKCGIRLLVRRRGPHATPNQNVVTHDMIVFDKGEKSKILRVNIDAIVFRQREPRFEFSGQVGLSVDWLDNFGLRSAADQLFFSGL